MNIDEQTADSNVYKQREELFGPEVIIGAPYAEPTWYYVVLGTKNNT